MLVLENRDVPGIIGSVGTCLGKHGINIAAMNWGRLKEGGDALTVINMDQQIPADVLKELQSLPNVLSAANIVI
jgi:D-3-phosphoglycerate dehydrogenase